MTAGTMVVPVQSMTSMPSSSAAVSRTSPTPTTVGPPIRTSALCMLPVIESSVTTFADVYRMGYIASSCA